MKKKVLAAVLSLALAFSMTACGGSGGGNATPSTPTAAQPESSAAHADNTDSTGSTRATPSTNSGTIASTPSTPDTPLAPPVGNPPAGNPPAGSPGAVNPPPAGGPGMMPPPDAFGADPFATEYLGEGVKFERPEAGTQPSAPPTAESLADSSVTVTQDGASVTVSHPNWGTKTVATDAKLGEDGTISIRTGTDQDGNPTYGMPLNLDAKWYAESGEVTLVMTPPPAGGPMGGPGGAPGMMPPPPFGEPNGTMPIPEDSEWTANPGSSTLITNAG